MVSSLHSKQAGTTAFASQDDSRELEQGNEQNYKSLLWFSRRQITEVQALAISDNRRGSTKDFFCTAWTPFLIETISAISDKAISGGV